MDINSSRTAILKKIETHIFSSHHAKISDYENVKQSDNLKELYFWLSENFSHESELQQAISDLYWTLR